MLKRIIILLAVAISTMSAHAKLKLSHLIGDNMVIQQNSDVRLWGWDNPGKSVRINTSWSSQEYSVKTDKNGRWIVKVQSPAASYTPLSISFSDGEDRIELKNILSGEVWVCAGQSNMEMPIKGFSNCPIEGYNETVMEANNYKGIHYIKVPSVMSMKPLEDADCKWEEINSNTVGEASATGYFFAQYINRVLNVPVGLVMANKGGSRVESWLTRENLKKYTEEPLDTNKLVKKYSWDYLRPLVWGNGTFNPILNYTVKGIIFYQGCSNVGTEKPSYSFLLDLLVKQWRSQFRLGEIPFYFVQIAPYWYDNVDQTAAAFLREEQLKASKIIPNSGIVCTNDLVYPWETQQIHPRQKRQVGERLAFQALNKTYGMKSIICESPEFDHMTVKGDTALIFLRNDYEAISRYEDFKGFEIAGEDRVFHPAEVSYDWRIGLMVKSPAVKKPVSVRYCFKNFQLGNVKNAGLLPLFPFRTDNWDK